MMVQWSAHSKEKFAERVLALGFNYGEIEIEIKHQTVRLSLGGKKYKTIFRLFGSFITVVKIDFPKKIYVLTVWESNQKEVDEWNRMNAPCAAQSQI